MRVFTLMLTNPNAKVPIPSAFSSDFRFKKISRLCPESGNCVVRTAMIIPVAAMEEEEKENTAPFFVRAGFSKRRVPSLSLSLPPSLSLSLAHARTHTQGEAQRTLPL